MPCPRLSECGLPGALESVVALLRWQTDYCTGGDDFHECHRYQATERGEPIPARMLPNGFVLPEPG